MLFCMGAQVPAVVSMQLNQELFEEVQCMHDPNELFRFLWQRAPYHVDALWAGHELYRCSCSTMPGCPDYICLKRPRFSKQIVGSASLRRRQVC